MTTLARVIRKDFNAFFSDIKILHSVFAIPFAFSAFLLGDLGAPSFFQLGLLVVCMVSARSFAMGMNRFLDRKIDAENPRTKGRAIPSGRITAKSMGLISLLWAAIFVAASWLLNSLAGYCSLGVLAILVAYPYWKRLSSLTHWYLGFCLALSPLAVAVAMKGSVPTSLFFLSGGILFWTAGFDILYAMQDLVCDKEQNLKSIPACFGTRVGIDISRLCFALMWLLLVSGGLSAQMGGIYYLGLLLIAGLLAYEQYLVRDLRSVGKSENLNVAFFNMNACVSILFFTFTLLDRLL